MSAVFSILLLVFLALFFLYRRRQPRHQYLSQSPNPVPQSLFDSPSAQSIQQMLSEKHQDKLLARAEGGDFSVLDETQPDKLLYNKLLSLLLLNNDVQALALHITERPALRTNTLMARQVIAIWAQTPTRRELGQMLHIAALSDDPQVYQLAVKTVMQAWDEGRLTQVSARDLAAVIAAEYWLLNPAARESGAGFFLKRSIAEVRRDLSP